MMKSVSIFLSFIAILSVSLACNFLAGGPEGVTLENLRTAYDQDGDNPTTVFAPSDVFYVVGDLNNAPAGTAVDAEWRAVQIEGYETDEVIYEQTISDFTDESFTGTIYFQLSNDNGWPVGDYKADIFLDGNFVDSVLFSVQ